MKAYNRFRCFIMIAMLFVMIVPAGVMAQEQPANSLTLSEASINEVLRANNQNPDNNLSVDLQNGQFVINLTSTGPRGNTTTFALTIVPSVDANRKLKLDATSLKLNDLEIPINNDNAAVTSTTDAVNGYLTEQTHNGTIQDVTVTEDRLVVSWTNNDPNAPTINIRDSLLGITFTEDSINQMSWVTDPAGANVSDITVDLQPDQALIYVSRTIDPTLVTYEIQPIIVNNYVAWQINAQADLESSLVSTLQTIWHAYFGGILGEGSMVNAVVTEDTIQFMWDLSNEVQETTPTVTYTVTEAEVNDILKAFTNEQVSNLFVDMQPEQLIITASGLGESGTPYAVSATLIPTFANGQVTWQVDSMTYNSVTIDNSKLEANNQITGALTRGIDSQQSNATITDFTMTDTDMSITVTYR